MLLPGRAPRVPHAPRAGCGGTQRLLHAVGKSKAMLYCLTGEQLSAEEAERAGLVARVYPADELVDRAVETAQKIASFSKPIAAMVKEAVNAAEQLPLDQGLRLERRLFHSTFATVRACRAGRPRHWLDTASSMSPFPSRLRARAARPPRGHVCFRREAQGRVQGPVV